MELSLPASYRKLIGDNDPLHKKVLKLYSTTIQTRDLIVEERRKAWLLAFGCDNFGFPKNIKELLVAGRVYGKAFGGKMIICSHSSYSEEFCNLIRNLYPLPYELGMIEINFDVPVRVKQ
jgi:hypothetical protein